MRILDNDGKNYLIYNEKSMDLLIPPLIRYPSMYWHGTIIRGLIVPFSTAMAMDTGYAWGKYLGKRDYGWRFSEINLTESGNLYLSIAFRPSFPAGTTKMIAYATAINKGSVKLPELLLLKSKIQVKDLLLSYFNEYFQQARKARLLYGTTPEDGLLDVAVEGVQTEVVKDKKLWERLQITLFYDTYELEQEDVDYIALKMRCVVDGRYGTGLGKPTSEGYTYPMDPEYAEQLKDYAIQFLMKLQEYLITIGGGVV